MTGLLLDRGDSIALVDKLHRGGQGKVQMGDVQGGQREQLHLLYVIGEVLGGEVLEKSYGGREEREGD